MSRTKIVNNEHFPYDIYASTIQVGVYFTGTYLNRTGLFLKASEAIIVSLGNGTPEILDTNGTVTNYVPCDVEFHLKPFNTLYML